MLPEARTHTVTHTHTHIRTRTHIHIYTQQFLPTSAEISIDKLFGSFFWVLIVAANHCRGLDTDFPPRGVTGGEVSHFRDINQFDVGVYEGDSIAGYTTDLCVCVCMCVSVCVCEHAHALKGGHNNMYYVA